MSAVLTCTIYLVTHGKRDVCYCRGAVITPLSKVLKISTAAACPHVHVRSAGEDDNDGWQKFNLQAVQHFGSGPRTKKQAGETKIMPQ